MNRSHLNPSEWLDLIGGPGPGLDPEEADAAWQANRDEILPGIPVEALAAGGSGPFWRLEAPGGELHEIAARLGLAVEAVRLVWLAEHRFPGAADSIARQLDALAVAEAHVAREDEAGAPEPMLQTLRQRSVMVRGAEVRAACSHRRQIAAPRPGPSGRLVPLFGLDDGPTGSYDADVRHGAVGHAPGARRRARRRAAPDLAPQSLGRDPKRPTDADHRAPSCAPHDQE